MRVWVVPSRLLKCRRGPNFLGRCHPCDCPRNCAVRWCESVLSGQCRTSMCTDRLGAVPLAALGFQPVSKTKRFNLPAAPSHGPSLRQDGDPQPTISYPPTAFHSPSSAQVSPLVLPPNRRRLPSNRFPLTFKCTSQSPCAATQPPLVTLQPRSTHLQVHKLVPSAALQPRSTHLQVHKLVPSAALQPRSTHLQVHKLVPSAALQLRSTHLQVHKLVPSAALQPRSTHRQVHKLVPSAALQPPSVTLQPSSADLQPPLLTLQPPSTALQLTLQPPSARANRHSLSE